VPAPSNFHQLRDTTSRQQRRDKLQKLVESEGHESLDDLLYAAAFDCVVPAICVAPGCDYTTEMEPDQDCGYCEACGRQTMQSCLILAGLI
jgi:hypothetical protein